MPGCPAIRLALPATMPPPNTSSTSDTPEVSRCMSCVTTSFTGSARNTRPVLVPPKPTTISASSWIVFHSPHCAQRPAHELVCAPQLLHTNLVAGFLATFSSYCLPLSLSLLKKQLALDC